MQVKIKDQIWNFDKSKETISELFDKVNSFLTSTNLYINYVLINNREVYDQFEEYFEEYAEDIESVEFVLSTKKELADQLILSSQAYLERALSEIPSLSVNFYQNEQEPAWDGFANLVDGLEWTYRSIRSLNEQGINQLGTDHFNIFISQYDDIAKKLDEAVHTKDMTWIGDMILYEIKPLYEQLYSNQQTIIDNEVRRHDLS